MSLVHNRCECKWDGCKAKSGIEGKMFLSVEISTRFQLVFSLLKKQFNEMFLLVSYALLPEKTLAEMI